MTPERFQQIEELFHLARERSEEERTALLAEVDSELRREVESLLAQRSGGELLERPDFENARRLLQHSTISTCALGTMLGPYRIENKLGEGGMGEVYRAVDTRLGRAVAIKITHEQFGDRFEREARAISALNHPHICTLYDIGRNYLVMELVEGETLAASLKTGSLPIRTSLEYAAQILATLVEAHEKGIIHRDLKPGNIMIAKSGIKILDFGLAKSRADDTVTGSNIVMGTPGYMAPEQREGKPADARSDLYSFGCVLYEMLTGAPVSFQRRRLSSTKLEKFVSRCLEEDPVRRWQSAAEALRALSDLSTGISRGRRDSSTTDRAPAYSHPGVEGRRRNTIVLADFVNTTGDPSFNGSLRQILAGELEKSLCLSILSDARVSETLRRMDRASGTQVTSDVASEICERTASAAVVEGSITSLGSKYVLSLRARNHRTDDIVEREQRSAAKKEDVFKLLAQMASRLRTRVAESLPVVEKQPALAVEATTPSLEAWKSYSAAMKAFQSKAQTPEIVLLLQRAIELDPKFAIAYAYLGRQQSDLGESELAAKNIAKAYELRDAVSDRENYFITFAYHRQATRNLELARQTLESWEQKYPGDFLAHSFLSGFTSPGSGHYDRALQEGLKAIELDPGFAIGYENVGWVYIYLNRPADAEALLRKASEHKIAVVQFSLLRYAIAFLRNDKAAMEHEVYERQGKLHAQGGFEHQQALTYAYQGRLKAADRLSERAVLLARQGGLLERAALFRGARAVWNALYGLPEEARRNAEAALSLSRSRDADYGPAFAFALLRDSTQVQKIAAELADRYPHDTSVQFSYLPALRALDILNQGDPAKALEITHAAVPYDFAVPATAYFLSAFFGALYPVYVRGLAYLQLGRYDEAASEFQAILDHPGLVLNDPIGPMARLQLARALSASGDRPKSAAAYKALLTVWSDADPALPILKETIAEYSKRK